MHDRDPEFATKAVAIIELQLSPPTDGPLIGAAKRDYQQFSEPDQLTLDEPTGPATWH